MKLYFSVLLTLFAFAGMTDSLGQKPLFTFGIISDVQYCDCDPAGSRFYRLSVERLRDAADSFGKAPVDFVVNLGDFIDRDYQSFKPLLEILDSSGLKVYHLKGNHDFSVDPLYRKRLPLPMPGNKRYYSFRYGNFRFIALDGNEVSTYASGSRTSVRKAGKLISALKESGSPNAMTWNGGISSGQLAWLKRSLDRASEGNEKVIILCHFPLYPDNLHNLLNYKEVIFLLENYKNIVACFSGHNHSGNYGCFNNIHFVTMKGMVETANSTSYAIAEVYADEIRIVGAGREESRILDF